ncbi:hypothetical protein FB567DRAFT_336417 [Paraphoma chrysanthemicola]|uniref:Uncharacterized protein n=1 Tax=Paraphoma chrysanthemicola TaxID=798071 RepID=A0A8K0R6V7_9PLEO|nr:hypothetical protein FB567DRAFT_336417 [Paraphoma chrysanthemicola]
MLPPVEPHWLMTEISTTLLRGCRTYDLRRENTVVVDPSRFTRLGLFIMGTTIYFAIFVSTATVFSIISDPLTLRTRYQKIKNKIRGFSQWCFCNLAFRRLRFVSTFCRTIMLLLSSHITCGSLRWVSVAIIHRTSHWSCYAFLFCLHIVRGFYD